MEPKRTFELAMNELESVVRQLEGGSLTLDQSLAAFEKGISVTRECETLLSEAKTKVEKLIKESNGATRTEPFEPKE